MFNYDKRLSELGIALLAAVDESRLRPTQALIAKVIKLKHEIAHVEDERRREYEKLQVGMELQ